MPNSIRNYIDFNIKPCHQSHSPIFFPFGQEASLAPKNSVDSYLSRIISLLTLSAKYIFDSLSFPLRPGCKAPPAPCNPANYVVRASYLQYFIQKNATPMSDVFSNETSGISPRGSNPSLFLNVKRAVFIGPRLFSH